MHHYVSDLRLFFDAWEDSGLELFVDGEKRGRPTWFEIIGAMQTLREEFDRKRKRKRWKGL